MTSCSRAKGYENVDKVFSFCSTHHNWSIILCCQELSQLDLNFKRFMNVWALWRPRDRVAAVRLSSIVGLSKVEMERLLTQLATAHDCLLIDSSGTAGAGTGLYICADGAIRPVGA